MNRTSRPARKRWGPAATLLALGLVLLAVEGGAFLVAQARPDLGVSAASTFLGNGSVSVAFTLSAGALPLAAHVALLPGSTGALRDPTVLYFADTRFPSLYASPSDTFSIGSRIATYFPLLGSHDRIVFADASTLGGLLLNHPYGTLVVAGGGVLPDSIFSPVSDTLKNWVLGGGTLVWAGGPLGYSSGYLGADGQFVYDSLYWAGQTDFLGFPLTDPNAGGAANSTPPGTYAPSPGRLAAALGITYQGVPTGANVTRLEAHGGFALGFISGRDPTGAAPRTSLAFLTVGAGSVYYFGGAVFQGGVGYVPQGSVNVSEDIALLLALGYRPAAGASAYVDMTVGSFATRSLTLEVPMPPAGLVAFVRSSVQGGVLIFWSAAVPATGPALLLGTLDAGPVGSRPPDRAGASLRSPI